MARLTFPADATSRVLAMIIAYFDESENVTDGDFIIAGYFAHDHVWLGFEAAWKAALADEKLGWLHWTDLCSGQDIFKVLTTKAARARVQSRFIEIMKGQRNIIGFSMAFKTADFELVKPVISEKRLQQYANPYLWGFEVTVGMIVNALLSQGQLGDTDQVAFVFDRNRKTSGRAKNLYDALLDLPNLPIQRHLGVLAFEDMRKFVPLQAADMLANETKRELDRARSTKRRWQYDRLFDDQVLDAVARREHFEAFLRAVRV